MAKTVGEERPTKRPMKKRIKHRYDRHMPNERHHRVLVWSLFFTCAVTVALQLLYPLDRALPLARVAGDDVGWHTHEQLAEAINTSFLESQLELVVDGQTTTQIPLASVGAEPNTEMMIEQVLRYPFWQRFIPFSILVNASAVNQADVYYTSSVLEAASEEQAATLSFEPVNASLAIEDGVLVATAEKRGSSVTADSVYQAIADSNPTLGGVAPVVVSASRTDPAEAASSLEAVREEAEVALGRRVIITAGNHTFMPDNTTVASWLQIGTDSSGEPTLELAADAMSSYFDMIDKETGVPAGQTNINLTNGREISRDVGERGRGIEREQLRERIGGWLLRGEGGSEFDVEFRDIEPSVIYDNKYTATEEGLRTYVADAAERMNVHIVIQQLDGEQWTASARADESIPSASTYKLFVAKWLFDQMDKGLIGWNDAMLGTTVSTCFDRMTIASTNPCAQSWLASAGRANVNQYVYDLGFSEGTTFTHPVATHTTASDLQRMMLGIHDGSIIDGAHKDRLLHSLATHPYRYGIPTGSAGEVWDKVGFLWDYVHDTAIVKHPKGTYIMTIMTKGQSYATIASLTREIERIMYP